MGVQVETAQGTLVGEQREGHQRFLGIPYAAPPVGERRFLSPAPASPWRGVRDAVAFGGSAPQPPSTGVLPVGRQDEDCLYLNVYTPAADGAKRPVMCFIHGGAFYLGSAAEATYDGGPLAERGDVVVVTINYRLGALGFLYLGAHGGDAWGATANAGLLDQVAALGWIRDHIAAFGGDPTEVTVFGESAGAFSVAALLAVDAARGLFKRAILQSGHANMVGNPDTASSVTQRWLQAAGVDGADRAALQALPVERILTAQTTAAGGDMRAFAPIVDGTVLPSLPFERVRDGAAQDVALLIGTNRDETKLFIDPKRPAIDEATLLRRAARILPRAPEAAVAEAVARYRESRSSRGLPHDNNDILDALETARRFRVPALRLAEAQARHQPRTFVYEFDWRSPAWRGTMGAAHALELPFVFGTVGVAMTRLTGAGPDLVPLSDRMMAAWLAFARAGDPNCEALGEPWPGYDAGTRATMIFDTHTRVVNAPFEEERAIWERMAPTNS